MAEKLDALMKNINKKYKEEIFSKGLSEFDYRRIPFSSPTMNYCTYGGIPEGKITEFYGEEHGGKALPLDCNILTPKGYVKMREIHEGDVVISGDGKRTVVTGVYPQGVKPMYRITFADHTYVDCSDEHLWTVVYHGSHGKTKKVLSTIEILNSYKSTANGRNKFKYSVETPIITDFDSKDELPINPYLLGVLLGDGTLGDVGVSVSLSEPDLVDRVSELVSDWGLHLKNITNTCDYHISYIDNAFAYAKAHGKTLRKELDKMGLRCKSIDKHIPKEYLFASVENRILLLQGLYDTDGYTSKDSRTSFSTSSQQLSEDFAFLVRSLGGLDMVTSSIGTYKKDGEYIECNTSFTHNIVFRNGTIPCSSEKHLKRYKGYRRCSYYRKIVNIEPIESAECQCIRVDADCHTFITDNVTVTHNTTTALDIVANYQQLHPDREILFVDAENALDYAWAKKLGVDTDILNIVQPKGQYAEEIFQIIHDAVDTGEVGLWVLDSIGVLVSQQEYDKTIEDKTYGGVSKPLTLFAKKIEMLMNRYNCTGIAINQIRENLNSSFGGTTTPGGKGFKHVCMVRMEFKKGQYIDEKGNTLTSNCANPSGNIVLMNMKKNKTCKPDRRVGSYTINYETGIDKLRDLIEMAVQFGIIDRHGAWFDIVDTETGEILHGKIQGQANVYALLQEDEELCKRVEELVNAEIYK